jgi:hypothetical protein
MKPGVTQREAYLHGCRSFLVEEGDHPLNLPFISKKLIGFPYASTAF